MHIHRCICIHIYIYMLYVCIHIHIRMYICMYTCISIAICGLHMGRWGSVCGVPTMARVVSGSSNPGLMRLAGPAGCWRIGDPESLRTACLGGPYEATACCAPYIPRLSLSLGSK